MFDIRALSLMRVCLAIVILLDLAIRSGDLEAFYANSGAVPLTMVFEHAWNKYFFSIHAISGLWQFQLLLFVLAFFCAAMLLIGYRTRLFTVLTWVLMVSLHNRNTLILQGGDDLLRMVLFWGMFMPWGARYSCDALLSSKKYEHRTLCTVATIAYLLQICYIYTGSALLKGPEWSRDFTAMYYVYGLDQIAYPVTKHFFYHPSLLKVMTMIAYYFELLVPVLFFIPVAHQWFRYLGVLLIIGFHTFNTFTLLIGMFPLIGIATSVGLLPAVALDHIEKLCSGLRSTVKDSFYNIGNMLRRVIAFRQPSYELTTWQQNVKTAVLIFLTIFVFDWNFSNLSFVNTKLSDNLRFIGYTLRLDQNWGMFAPGVFKDDGWFVYEANTEDGRCFDLLCPDKEINYSKPEAVTAMFKNDRWRKFSENLILQKNTFMRGYFTNYYRRIWNESNPDRKINGLQLVYMSEFTKPGYARVAASKEVLWKIN